MSETQTAVPVRDNQAADCGGCSDEASFEATARELYQTAALFLGHEGEATDLVEQTLANVDVDPCAEPRAARSAVIGDLVSRTLARAAAKWPAEMHPTAAADLHGCVETDELSAAGVTQEQLNAHLEAMVSGAGLGRMRQWLESLRPAERIVFVLRAVLGRSSSESTELLHQATADRWTEAEVGGAYRAALCSLASSLVHAGSHPSAA